MIYPQDALWSLSGPGRWGILADRLGVSPECPYSDARSGLSEHELDHVFPGWLEGEPQPDPEEIDGLRWIECAELERDVAGHPERYTPWFAKLVARLPELRAAAAAAV